MPREHDSTLLSGKSRTTRIYLRRKLLCYFSLGLAMNFVNLTVYILMVAFFDEYYVELSTINGNVGALYLIANLYFLDVLRDGVMSPSSSLSPPERAKDITELVIRNVRTS
jgi:hypothetical protein